MGSNKIIEKLKKNYKDDVIDPDAKVKRISTGSMNIDNILNGGIPIGRITEVLGETGSGKSSICLSTIKEAQKQGLNVAYIDMEGSADNRYLKAFGIDTKNLLLLSLPTAEKVFDESLNMFKEGIDLIILDSVSVMPTEAEEDGKAGDSHIGVLARLMSQNLKKINQICNKQKKTMIFINQTRTKIGVVYGDPMTTSGGVSLGFYSSLRLKISQKKKEKIKYTKIKVIKSKVSPLELETLILITDDGIDKEREIIENAVNLAIIEKNGAFFKIPNIDKKIQGLEKVKKIVKEDPELKEYLLKEIKESLGE